MGISQRWILALLFLFSFAFQMGFTIGCCSVTLGVLTTHAIGNRASNPKIDQSPQMGVKVPGSQSTDLNPSRYYNNSIITKSQVSSPALNPKPSNDLLSCFPPDTHQHTSCETQAGPTSRRFGDLEIWGEERSSDDALDISEGSFFQRGKNSSESCSWWETRNHPGLYMVSMKLLLLCKCFHRMEIKGSPTRHHPWPSLRPELLSSSIGEEIHECMHACKQDDGLKLFHDMFWKFWFSLLLMLCLFSLLHPPLIFSDLCSISLSLSLSL